MATQDVWTRQWLRDQGFSDDEIGWRQMSPNSGVVTLRGQDFITAHYPGGGKSYASQQALEDAFQQWQRRQQPATQQTQPQVNFQSEIQSLAQELRQRLNQPQQEFNYNPYTDPQYTAALARTQQNIQQGQNQIMAEMNRRGLLTSTITGDRSQRIAAQEMSNLEQNIVPMLVQQAYQRFQDQQRQQQQQYQNALALLDAFAAQDQRSLDNLYRDRAFDRGVYESDRDYSRRVLEADREFQYRAARDAIADQRWQQQFDEDVRRFGLEYALQRQIQLGNLDVARMNAATSRMNAETSASNAQLNRLMSLWEATGVAPEGIRGVEPGTPYQAYRQTAPQPTQNDLIAEYVANLDRLPQDQIERVLKEERANIIRDIGTSGYNFLVSTYIKSQSAQNELLKGLLNE